MKKTLLLSAALLAAGISVKAQFNTVGAANYNSSTGLFDMVPVTVSTPVGNHVRGAAWSTGTVDFTESFTLDFDASFTTIGGGGAINGADGLMAVFGNNVNPTSTIGGVGGGDLAYYNTSSGAFNNSIGVEFDIFYNSPSTHSDIPSNHVMIAKNGGATGTDVLAPAVSIDPSGADVEDMGFKHYRIQWDCITRRLKVYYNYNPAPRIDISITPSTIFFNPAQVYWGFTAARQAASSHHHIRSVSMQQHDHCKDECRLNPSLDIHMLGCQPSGAYQIGVTALAYPSSGRIGGKITVDFGDGTPPQTMLVSVPSSITHYYFVPGTYTITMKVAGYNTVTHECCEETIVRTIVIPACPVGDDNGGGKDTWPQGKAAPSGVDGVQMQQMRMNPNPTTGEISIDVPAGTFDNIIVTDMAGREVYSRSEVIQNKTTIDLANLPNGAYIITVSGEGKQYRDKVMLHK